MISSYDTYGMTLTNQSQVNNYLNVKKDPMEILNSIKPPSMKFHKISKEINMAALIYGTMFTISSWLSNLVVCRDHLLRSKKGVLVNPSQLNEKWFLDRKPVNSEKIRLL